MLYNKLITILSKMAVDRRRHAPHCMSERGGKNSLGKGKRKMGRIESTDEQRKTNHESNPKMKLNWGRNKIEMSECVHVKHH